MEFIDPDEKIKQYVDIMLDIKRMIVPLELLSFVCKKYGYADYEDEIKKNIENIFIRYNKIKLFANSEEILDLGCITEELKEAEKNFLEISDSINKITNYIKKASKTKDEWNEIKSQIIGFVVSIKVFTTAHDNLVGVIK